MAESKGVMKFKPVIWITSCLTFLLLLANCKKESVFCPESDTFCAFVNQQLYDSTGTIINQFLESFDQNKSDEVRLEKLKNWLNSLSCVENAEIICLSCIKTNPPQSELKVVFVSGGQMVELILDILMGEKLRFVRYHE
mgnify:CR=1 FL=1